MDDEKDLKNQNGYISSKKEQPNKIVVVSGDGDNLDISEVHTHLNIEKPSTETPDDRTIVIPPDSSDSNK